MTDPTTRQPQLDIFAAGAICEALVRSDMDCEVWPEAPAGEPNNALLLRYWGNTFRITVDLVENPGA